MKKLLIAASLAALAAPATAADNKTGTLNVDLEGYVEYSCGFADSLTVLTTYDIERDVKFDLASATSGEIKAAPADGSTNPDGSSASFRAFCNSDKGAQIEYQAESLLRDGGDPANALDTIPVRAAFYYRPGTGAFVHPARYHAVPYTNQNPTHVIGHAFNTSVAGSFWVPSVKLADGSYTKHAGDYAAVFTATLTAVE